MSRFRVDEACSARIVLRALRSEDADGLLEVLGDPRVMRYWSHAPLRTPDDMAWYLRDAEAGRRAGTHWRWAIARSRDDRLIGMASLHCFSPDRRHASLGIALAHAAQGQGLAHAAVGALVAIGFDAFALATITADVDRANRRSRALLERLGFREEGADGDGLRLRLSRS